MSFVERGIQLHAQVWIEILGFSFRRGMQPRRVLPADALLSAWGFQGILSSACI